MLEKPADRDNEIQRIKDNCTVIRLLAHTQIKKIGLRQKKAHLVFSANNFMWSIEL